MAPLVRLLGWIDCVLHTYSAIATAAQAKLANKIIADAIQIPDQMDPHV